MTANSRPLSSFFVYGWNDLSLNVVDVICGFEDQLYLKPQEETSSLALAELIIKDPLKTYEKLSLEKVSFFRKREVGSDSFVKIKVVKQLSSSGTSKNTQEEIRQILTVKELFVYVIGRSLRLLVDLIRSVVDIALQAILCLTIVLDYFLINIELFVRKCIGKDWTLQDAVLKVCPLSWLFLQARKITKSALCHFLSKFGMVPKDNGNERSFKKEIRRFSAEERIGKINFYNWWENGVRGYLFPGSTKSTD